MEQKQKKLKEYKAEQLPLPFVFLKPEPDYSNSIELYDAIPKYYWGRIAKAERKAGRFLDSLKREFAFRNALFHVRISPARIEENGSDMDYFPGEKEEFVEAALRKMACDGTGRFLDGKAGVIFTLSELQRRLKGTGHSYSLDQIKKSIKICRGTQLELESPDGKVADSSSIFPRIGFKEDLNGQTRCYVVFNELVTVSIKHDSYRLMNYTKYMSLDSSLSRYLHMRMSHMFRQADWTRTYDITLSTLLRDSGKGQYTELRNSLRETNKALDELKDKCVIADYTSERIKNGRKTVDVKFSLKPHREFIRDTIKANGVKKESRLKKVRPTP